MLNFTQHPATPEQLAAGVIDLLPNQRKHLIDRLTVNSLPTKVEIGHRCADIAQLALDLDATEVMIGCAPWMMATLERWLTYHGIKFFYAFSVRVSKETLTEGVIVKTSEFKHAGFI